MIEINHCATKKMVNHAWNFRNIIKFIGSFMFLICNAYWKHFQMISDYFWNKIFKCRFVPSIIDMKVFKEKIIVLFLLIIYNHLISIILMFQFVKYEIWFLEHRQGSKSWDIQRLFFQWIVVIVLLMFLFFLALFWLFQ